MFKPNKIILHHSATKDSGTVSWGAIRRYHKIECAWTDIGYHFGIELVEDVVGNYFETFIGRLPDESGAHTSGHNSSAFGVCFVGNYDEVVPPEEMLNQGARLVAFLSQNYQIPVERIFGHREFANKTCPGKLFGVELFRARVWKAKERIYV